MTKRIIVAFSLVLAAVALSANVAVAEVFDPDMVIQYQIENEATTQHGYQEHMISARNTSPKRTHGVTVTLGPDASMNGDCLSRVTRTVEVGPGATVSIRIPQAALPINSSAIAIAIDGREAGERLRVDFRHSSWSGSKPRPYLLVGGRSPSLADVRTELASTFPDPDGSSSGSSRSDFAFDSDMPLATWSDHWLAYTRYDGIVLTGSNLTALPAPVMAAITNYIEAGGTLIVAGDYNPPADWRRRSSEFGSLLHVGFGAVVILKDEKPSKWTFKERKLIEDAVNQTAAPWKQSNDVLAANTAFPVVDSLQIPVAGLFVMMLLFAAAIGPVNLITLSMKKRRIWILWTAPAIALFFSAAVFGYNLFAEGWTGHRRTSTFTILDQARHRATTIGMTAFYCPLTPSSGLHFSADTELTPLVDHNNYGFGPFGGPRNSNSSRARSVNWTVDQHLDSGWVIARVPAHFMVRKSAPERQRVEVVTESGGAITALNGLTADIRQFYYADDQGAIYEAKDIRAGQKSTLTLMPGKRAAGPVDALRARVLSRVDWRGSTAGGPIEVPEYYLRGRDYIAITDTPMLEAGLESAAVVPNQSTIYGILE